MSKKADIYTQLTAFGIFIEDGIDAVAVNFPEQLEFVKANMDKTMEQVEKMLFIEATKV